MQGAIRANAAMGSKLISDEEKPSQLQLWAPPPQILPPCSHWAESRCNPISIKRKEIRVIKSTFAVVPPRDPSGDRPCSTEEIGATKESDPERPSVVYRSFFGPFFQPYVGKDGSTALT